MPRTRSSLLNERAEAARRLGIRLAAARGQAGLSQLSAAKSMGVAKSTIAKLELGKRQLLFLEGMLLAELYGVDCRQLSPSDRENDPNARESKS
ncbi:MAG TPA: helix-turn-helix transcriptional regulator [Candidatus Dormibacteraeota bacterium]|nr:helix-turn-helix transcriptional regulator [Candidatus Dormibacteraeota bacterium]